MEEDFDVQRDHVRLIRLTSELLAPGGTLVFSNNFTRFKLAREELTEFDIKDWTRDTLPRDFERSPKIHSCFAITRP
jgi:23S rRNA (guanine2445-N2)-methyltransferase / 23S rRNA (guanine2069-N7)-methyltransferase